MTRAEAIRVLKDEIEYKHDYPYDKQAYEMAISELEKEPCEDAISREDALKVIYDFKEKHTEDREKHPINYGTLLDLIRLMRELPSVTPSRRKGHWIKSRDSYGNNHFTCSECGNDIATQYADDWHDNYCNECGADMR